MGTSEWIARNKKYDYESSCCCGSYVIQENTYTYHQDKTRKKCYSGIIREIFKTK